MRPLNSGPPDIMHLGNDPPSKMTLNALEREVLRALATALGEPGAALHVQAERAAVLARNHSGVGFVTKLKVPDGIPALPEDCARRIRPVHAAHPQLIEPAEFVVQVKSGQLASIEAFCHDGVWPTDESQFRVSHNVLRP